MPFARTHTFPLIALFVLTLLVVAPLIAFPFYAGEEYQGINIAHFGNDEHFYLSRAKEALEGHSLGQPFLAEGKEQLDASQNNTEQIMLSPLYAAGLGSRIDPVMLYNILNFIGVFFILVLAYVFLYLLSSDILIAVTGALFAVGGYMLIENGTILYSLISGRELVYSNFNIFGRSLYPFAGLVPFLGFLIYTYRAAESAFQRISRATLRPYMYVLAAGALFGLQFYLYLYAWTFSLAFLGALAFSAIIFRKRNAFLVVLGVGTIGILIGAYKLFSYYILFTSSWMPQLSFFFLSIHSRSLIMSKTGVAVALLFALYFYFRRKDPSIYFIFAVILAGWIALEQQLITGITVQYAHYYWYFIVPLTILIGVYMSANLIPERLRSWRMALCALLIGVAFLNTAAGQYKSFWTTIPGKMREQQFAPIIKTLQQSPKGVVLGDPGGESYPFMVTIYTDDDAYWMPGATTSIFPMSHYKKALFTYLYLNKDSRRDPVTYLSQALASSTRTIYTNMYEEIEGYGSGISPFEYREQFPHTSFNIAAVRPGFLQTIGAEYKDFAQSSALVRERLVQDGVRYVLWDKRQYPEWDLSVLAPLSLIATSTDLELYLVVSSSNHSLSTK